MRSEIRIRDDAVQSWPELKKPPILTASATVAGSASSSTTIGAFPPSSRWTRLTVSAAFFAMSFPVAVSPVSETRRIEGCRTSRSPAGTPSPVTTWRTPFGRMSCASSTNRRVVRGVCSAGLTIWTFPAASAGAIFQITMNSG